MIDDLADVVVVGAGIIGLATAWQLLKKQPGLEVVVVEKESSIAQHQSSHNSGVLHAGIYYPPGSLKAEFCGRGKRLIEKYAADRGIPIKRNGKLIIATRRDELGRLQDLLQRAKANDVADAHMVGPSQIRDIEPAAIGLAALHSPSTGVIDFEAVCRSLVDDVTAAGAAVRTGWRVDDLVTDGDRVRVQGDQGTIRAKSAITCGGVQADRLAGEPPDARIVPFRGSWYRLSGTVASTVRGNIYPVPDPRFPFLGVHVTRRIDGDIWAGPNAFLTLDREGSRRGSVNAADARSSLLYSGFWRFAGRHLRAAVPELAHELSKKSYAAEVSRYLPDVQASDLERGPAGIRAQVITRGGRLEDDFMIRDDGAITHVLSAPSPAATASIAIGEHLAERVLEKLHH